jgi:hypothetical protein
MCYYVGGSVTLHGTFIIGVEPASRGLDLLRASELVESGV